MSATSWWIAADREAFTRACEAKRAEMEQGIGAKIARQLSWDSASEQQDKKDRKGGKWGNGSAQS